MGAASQLPQSCMENSFEHGLNSQVLLDFKLPWDAMTCELLYNRLKPPDSGLKAPNTSKCMHR